MIEISRKMLNKRNLTIVLAFICLFSFLSILNLIVKPQAPRMNAGSVLIAPKMALGVVIDSASSVLEKDFSMDLSGAKAEIDSASALGMDFVRFDIKKEILDNPKELAKIDEAISYAKEKNLKIFLGYLGRQAWLSYFPLSSSGAYGGGGKASWEEFKKGYTEDVDFIIGKYRPDYILILPDCPFGIGQQVNSERTVEEWFNFSKDVAFSIKKISYGTKVILQQTMSSDPRKQPEMELAKMALANNDSVLDAISVKADSVDILEKETKDLSDYANKNHWHGELWITSVDSSFLDDNVLLGSKEREIQRKDFYLYSIHVANNENFGGVIIAKLKDDKIDESGIIEEDYSPKISYTGLAELIKNRK